MTWSYLAKRIAAAVVTVWAIATVVFVGLNVTSDPVASLVNGEATTEQLAAVRHSLGLDQPLLVQYLDFMRQVATGQMAPSYRMSQPALELVLERFPKTVELATAAVALGLLFAVPLGVVSAIWRNSFVDYIASAVSFFGFAVPGFWLGTMLVLIFAVTFKWLPPSGDFSSTSLVLPAITLSMWPLGQFTRLIRSELLNVLGEDYVRTARAKGLTEWVVIRRHALRNALIPIVTMLGLMLGDLLGGAVITETIFAWPGMGRLALEATSTRDFPVIEAVVVFTAIVFAVVNLVVDLVYVSLNPRVSYG